MGVEVNGLVEMRRALAKFAPDLKKELDKETRNALKVMVNDAKSYASNDNVPSRWRGNEGANPLRTFANRRFPLWDLSEVIGGINYKSGESKTNTKGFRSLYRLQNQSPAGAIYEWAGRISGSQGLPWIGPKGDPGNRKVSHSNWKGAGKQFIKVLDERDNYRTIKGRKDGRLIHRAVEKDQGKFRKNVLASTERVMKLTQARLDAIPTVGSK